MRIRIESNFSIMKDTDSNVYEFAIQAERHLYLTGVPDPNATMYKCRGIAERIAKLILGTSVNNKVNLEGLEKILHRRYSDFPIKQFRYLRKKGNNAVHNFSKSFVLAATCLRYAFELCVWYLKQKTGGYWIGIYFDPETYLAA